MMLISRKIYLHVCSGYRTISVIEACVVGANQERNTKPFNSPTEGYLCKTGKEGRTILLQQDDLKNWFRNLKNG